MKKWSKEIVYNIALKYDFRNDFRINDNKAYSAARKHKWLNDVCSHMKNGKICWTKEKVIELSKNYETRKSFMCNEIAAYKAAFKYGWLSDISFDKVNYGSRYKRIVYVYEFSDNTAYIGLTYNESRRHSQHLICGPVFSYTNESKIIPDKKILSDGYIDVDKAIVLEMSSIAKYKNNGWKLLNKTNGGETGGGKIKELKEKYKKEALKYDYRGDFKKYSPNMYSAARKKKCLDEICGHMLYKYKKKREE